MHIVFVEGQQEVVFSLSNHVVAVDGFHWNFIWWQNKPMKVSMSELELIPRDMCRFF